MEAGLFDKALVRGRTSVGTLIPLPQWDLRINAKNLAIDDDLRKGLPASLSAMLDSVKAKGTLGVELEKFVYRGGGAAGEVAEWRGGGVAESRPGNGVTGAAGAAGGSAGLLCGRWGALAVR